MATATGVRIDATQIPACAFDLACSVLQSSIRAALADPRVRREYEDWKKKRNAAKAAS